MLNKFHITANQNMSITHSKLENHWKILIVNLRTQKKKRCSQDHPERKDNLPKVI